MKRSVRYWKYFQTIGCSPLTRRRRSFQPLGHGRTITWSYSSSRSSGSSGCFSAGRCRQERMVEVMDVVFVESFKRFVAQVVGQVVEAFNLE